MGMCCEQKTIIGKRNIWSMKWRVPGKKVIQRKLGERWKNCQTRKLNMDRNRWRKQIRDDW